ncbi:MAG: hypothetical protein U1E65_08240 [Myxococcota bacterium]
MFVRGLLSILVLLGASACDGARQRPGGSSNHPRDAGTSNGSDAGEERGDSAELDAETNDRGEQGLDLGFVFPDAETDPPDQGFGFPDGSFFDASDFDAGFPPHDAGFIFPDAAPHDAGFVFPDATVRDTGVTGPDGGAPAQTQITVVAGSESLTLGTAANGDHTVVYSATLEYVNAGPGSETISVTQGALGAGALPLGVFGMFAVVPDYTAPVGTTTHNVQTVPGASFPSLGPLDSIFCSLPLSAVLTFSNGTTAVGSATATCN